MAHFGFSGSEWRPMNGFAPLESDSCYDSGLHQTSYDSGLGLNYESQSLSSETRPVQSEIRPSYGSEISSVADSERETLEREFHRMNLMTSFNEQAGNLQNGVPVTEPQGSFGGSAQSLGSAFNQQPQYADLFQPDEEGDTQLHLAIIKPNLDAALWLLSAPWPPGFLDLQNAKYFHTALHLAVITNQSRVVRALVVQGACVNMRDHQGNTPVHIACARGLVDCLRQLTAPLCEQERQELYVKYGQSCVGLQWQPVDFTIKNYEGQTCLHVAQDSPACSAPARVQVIRYLVTECLADVNMQEGKCGCTVLHQAIKCKDYDVIKFLLSQTSQRLDVNVACYNYSNALSIATSLRLNDVTAWLARCGAVEQCGGGGSSSDGKDSEDSEDEVMDRFDDLVISGQNRNLHYS